MGLVLADSGSDITYFFTDLLFEGSDQGALSPAYIAMALVTSTLLTYVLAQTYRKTYRGTSYTQGYVVSLFFMSMTTAIIMVIIGSNIARAFSLVGALSIIRFRTAVKDARDIAFLFLAIAVGMACGTGVYAAGIILTLGATVLMFLLHVTNYGAQRNLENVVRITFSGSEATAQAINSCMEKHFKGHQLINRVLDFGGGHAVNVYTVKPSSDQRSQSFENAIRDIEGVDEVAMYQSDQHVAL